MITKLKLYEEMVLDTNYEKSQVAVKVLHILSQIQIFHWQVDKLGDHKTFDDFSNDFKENADKLVEVIQGKYGRVLLDDDTQIPIRNIKELDPYQYADNCIDLFKIFQTNLFSDDDSEILSLLDESIAQLQQLKYLLSFK